jgi:hypothetical protein
MIENLVSPLFFDSPEAGYIKTKDLTSFFAPKSLKTLHPEKGEGVGGLTGLSKSFAHIVSV